MSEQSRVEELHKMPYEFYLQTPEWQTRRQDALERAEHHCQVCYGNDALDVHHRTYERRGNERPGDLTVLCRTCHTLFHGRQNVKNLTTPFVPLENALVTEMDRLAQSDVDPGILLGYRDLDLLLQGLQPGSLTVLSGRPFARADLLAFNFALNAANNQKVTFLFSFNPTQEQLTQQLLAIKSQVEPHRIQSGNLSDDEWEALTLALEELAKLPLICCTDAGLTVQDMRARLLEYLARADAEETTKIDFILIDGFALLEHVESAPRESSYQQLFQTVRSLKLLAKEFRAPLLLTYPLSAQKEARRRIDDYSDMPQFVSPQLSDLQPLSAFEQFADSIAFMSLDERDTYRNATMKLTEISIASTLFGTTGPSHLYYNTRTGAFTDLVLVTDDEINATKMS